MITYKQWQDYKERSGDDFGVIIPDQIISNEKGFITYSVEAGILVVHQLYGINEGEYWRNFIIDEMKKRDCKKVQFFTKRNPEVYIRWFNKLKVHGYILQYEEEEK